MGSCRDCDWSSVLGVTPILRMAIAIDDPARAFCEEEVTSGQTSDRHGRNDSDRVGRGNWRWFTAGESKSSNRGRRDWWSGDVGTR